MNSSLSFKCALAVFLPGQSGLVFRFVCVSPAFWIAFLRAEAQGCICEILEGQRVPYLFCEEMEVNTASLGCDCSMKWTD